MIDVANAGGTKGKHCICLQYLIEKGRETYKMTVCECLQTYQLCMCVSHMSALHFIRTRRDGGSDSFREWTHKSICLHWLG